MRIYSLSIVAVISVLTSCGGGATFGCKNSMISDDWRTAVLDFHNKLRKKVATGVQQTNGGKGTMPYAKKMNQLTWDCTLEHNAWLNLCDSNVKIDNNYAESAQTPIKTGGTTCNLTTKTLDVLKEFAKESNSEDLSQNVQYSDKIKNFGLMVAQDAKGFACTYNKCAGNSQTNFVCLYDKKLTAPNALYETEQDQTKICDDCAANGNKPKCIDYLCQYEYKLAANANPQPLCGDDGMTRDMQDAALYMHNYYRKTIATGWTKSKTGYAPRAKNMNALQYDCTGIGMKTKDLIDCQKHSYTNSPGHSLNSMEFPLSVTREQALEQAISAWYGGIANIDLDKDATYNSGVEANAKSFANMAVGEATKFGCAAEQCTAAGFTVAVCQYDQQPDNDTPLYTVGRPCSGCNKGTQTCDQTAGLCVTPTP